MTMIESMMNFMLDRMSKEDIQEMMVTVAGDISSEERRELMATMMPKMMAGTNMMDMMSKMMGADGGCRPPTGSAGAGMPMAGMMARMMPRCLEMGAKQVPAEERLDAVVDLLATLAKSGCEAVESGERLALLHALKSRLEDLETTSASA